jgi:hypothetical protein
MKKYVVVERKRKIDGFEFINSDTKDLGEIWITSCPYKINDDSRESLSPLFFEKRSDAVKYKDVQQSQSDKDWRENSYIYKRYGDSKPKWKIEEYKGDLFK